MKQVRSWKSLAVIAVLVALSIVAITVAAQDTPVPPTAPLVPAQTLTVSGFGQAFGAPDIAYVQLGVQVSNNDVIAAFDDANTRMEAVLAALREAGVEGRDLQTSGLYMYQENVYDPMSGMPTDSALYRVGNTVTVTVRDVNEVSEIISTGVEAGANNINSLSFGIAEPTALEDEARAAAVEDARTRANKLAELMGVTVGEPTIIVEGAVDNMPFPMADRAFGGSANVPIEQGQLSVSVNVRVTFSIS